MKPNVIFASVVPTFFSDPSVKNSKLLYFSLIFLILINSFLLSEGSIISSVIFIFFNFFYPLLCDFYLKSNNIQIEIWFLILNYRYFLECIFYHFLDLFLPFSVS